MTQVHMSESDLQASIVTAARQLGWIVGYTYNSQKSETGEPDLRMVHPQQRRVIFMELKTEKGKLRKGRWNKKQTRWLPGQDEWKAALEACEGLEYYLVRPSDIEDVYQLLQTPTPARGGKES